MRVVLIANVILRDFPDNKNVYVSPSLESKNRRVFLIYVFIIPRGCIRDVNAQLDKYDQRSHRRQILYWCVR